MYNFRIRHGVLGWSHKRRWKDTVTLGMRIPFASASSFLGSPHETWCPLNGEEKIRSSQTPLPTPGVIRHRAQVHSMRWGTLHLRAHTPSAQSKPRPMTWFPHSGSARWTVGRPAIQRLFVPPTIFFLCFKDKKSKLDSHVLQSTVLSYGALKDFSEIPQCLPLRKPESEDDLRHAQVGNDFEQIPNFDTLMCGWKIIILGFAGLRGNASNLRTGERFGS